MLFFSAPSAALLSDLGGQKLFAKSPYSRPTIRFKSGFLNTAKHDTPPDAGTITSTAFCS